MPIEIVVEHIVTAVIIGGVIIGIAYSPLFRALGHRLMHGRAQLPVAEDPRVDDLSGEVAALRQQLDETQDRLDFTERMLAQARAKGELNASGRDD